jgi:hypothetical protein
MDTSAIMGFMNSLMDVIKEKTDHLAVLIMAVVN